MVPLSRSAEHLLMTKALSLSLVLVTSLTAGCSLKEDDDDVVSEYLPYWSWCNDDLDFLKKISSDRPGIKGFKLLKPYSISPPGTPMNTLVQVDVVDSRRESLKPLLNAYLVGCSPTASNSGASGVTQSDIASIIQSAPSASEITGEEYLVTIKGSELTVYYVDRALSKP